MNLFLYLDRDSPVHRLDPRTKLFLMLGSFAVAVLFFAPTPLLLLLGVLLVYGALGRALGNLRRVWVLLLSIAAVSILSWSIFAGGSTPLVWRATREGFIYLTATQSGVGRPTPERDAMRRAARAKPDDWSTRCET